MGDRGDLPPDFSNEDEREQWFRHVLGAETNYREQIREHLDANGDLNG